MQNNGRSRFLSDVLGSRLGHVQQPVNIIFSHLPQTGPKARLHFRVYKSNKHFHIPARHHQLATQLAPFPRHVQHRSKLRER